MPTYKEHLKSCITAVENLRQRTEVFASKSGVNDVISRNELANACSQVYKRYNCMLADKEAQISPANREKYVDVGAHCVKIRTFIREIGQERFSERSSPSIAEVIQEARSTCELLRLACLAMYEDNRSWFQKLLDGLRYFFTWLSSHVTKLKIKFGPVSAAIQFKQSS